jgi:hypothetical protein
MRVTNALVNAAVLAVPPRSPVRTLSMLSVSSIARAQARRLVDQLAVVEHQRAGQQQRRGVGDALAGDVGRRAVHRLEDRRIGADVGARRHAQAAHQAGHQVGQDVAEQVGRHQHVELLGLQHQLHRAGVDDHGVELELALVLALFVEVEAGLQEDAGQRLHDVGLVHDGDLLAAGGDRRVEGVFEQAPAARRVLMPVAMATACGSSSICT